MGCVRAHRRDITILVVGPGVLAAVLGAVAPGRVQPVGAETEPAVVVVVAVVGRVEVVDHVVDVAGLGQARVDVLVGPVAPEAQERAEAQRDRRVREIT